MSECRSVSVALIGYLSLRSRWSFGPTGTSSHSYIHDEIGGCAVRLAVGCGSGVQLWSQVYIPSTFTAQQAKPSCTCTPFKALDLPHCGFETYKTPCGSASKDIVSRGHWERRLVDRAE